MCLENQFSGPEKALGGQTLSTPDLDYGLKILKPQSSKKLKQIASFTFSAVSLLP